MPSGSKKRKALRKKQQEAIGVTTNNQSFNSHGNDEEGSQDERESDSSLSSPGSQGNEESGTKDLSPSPLSVLVNVTAKDADVSRGHGAKGVDFIVVGKETDHEENGVYKQGACGTSVLEIAPDNDSIKPMGSYVSKVVVSDKNEQVESLKDSGSVKQKSDENEEKLELKEAKEGNFRGSSAETSKGTKSGKESEAPECSEEKSLLSSGPPVVRTSWLSCCGLFDVMAGSER